MREILFRGKRIDNGEWVYGSYAQQYGCHEILLEHVESEYGFDRYHVDPETVGQYTGLKDKNGKPIFEGDIIAISNEHMTRFNSLIIEVVWDDYVCGFAPFEYDDFRVHINECGCRVIGNIYDNPKLLVK